MSFRFAGPADFPIAVFDVAMVKSNVIFSRAGVEIITKPYLVGAELEALSLEASKDWIASLEGVAELDNPTSLEILNG